jgi:hypothetical protein
MEKRKFVCKLWIWEWIDVRMRFSRIFGEYKEWGLKERVGTHPLKMGFPSKVVTEAGRP